MKKLEIVPIKDGFYAVRVDDEIADGLAIDECLGVVAQVLYRGTVRYSQTLDGWIKNPVLSEHHAEVAKALGINICHAKNIRPYQAWADANRNAEAFSESLQTVLSLHYERGAGGSVTEEMAKFTRGIVDSFRKLCLLAVERHAAKELEEEMPF